MTVECIDGRSGAPHIDGADKGRLHAGIAGERSGVMQVGKRLAATQDSANKVTVAVGDALIHGRQCSVTAPEQVTITSGTQGQRRNDLICLHYMRRASGSDYIDSAELAVLRGTPTTGTPADPTVPVGNVLDGASDDWLPLYRVSLDGVTAAKPVQVFDLLPTLQSVWDSISRRAGEVSTPSGITDRGCSIERSGGDVQLTLNVASGQAVWLGQLLATVPAGWRPPVELDIACAFFDGADYPMAGWVAVMPDGRVMVKEYISGGRKGLQVKAVCRYYAA